MTAIAISQWFVASGGWFSQSTVIFPYRCFLQVHTLSSPISQKRPEMNLKRSSPISPCIMWTLVFCNHSASVFRSVMHISWMRRSGRRDFKSWMASGGWCDVYGINFTIWTVDLLAMIAMPIQIGTAEKSPIWIKRRSLPLLFSFFCLPSHSLHAFVSTAPNDLQILYVPFCIWEQMDQTWSKRMIISHWFQDMIFINTLYTFNNTYIIQHTLR